MTTFSTQMFLSQGHIWRWKATMAAVTADDIATWFERAYPEPWVVKARRLRECAEEAAQFSDYRHRKAVA